MSNEKFQQWSAQTMRDVYLAEFEEKGKTRTISDLVEQYARSRLSKVKAGQTDEICRIQWKVVAMCEFLEVTQPDIDWEQEIENLCY